MSDVLRTYSGAALSRRRRSKGGRKWRWLLLIVLLGTLWTLWITRDAQPLWTLSPTEQRYHVYVAAPLETRMSIAQSRIWAMAPQGSVWSTVPVRLMHIPGMPEWVLNNVFNGPCHVSGNDLKTFSDPLLLTRMSRFGCLIEKLQWAIPGVASDHAGGLRLRRIADAGLYYAVRGRTFAVSPSRDALIRALTLTPEEQAGPEGLMRGLADLGVNEIACRVDLDADDFLGEAFETLRLGVRTAPAGARLSCRSTLRPAWRERCADLLDGVAPRELKTPPEGLLVATLDLGKPLPQVLTALNAALDGALGLDWLSPGAAASESPDPIQQFAAAIIHAAGTDLCLVWQGMDLHEMAPVPELTLFSSTEAARALASFAALPAPPPDAPPWEMVPRYDAEQGILWLPMIGGPSMQPIAGLRGDELVFSSSRIMGEALLMTPPGSERLPQPGNLYLRARPHPCMQAITDAAAQLAAFGLIRGHDEASFAQTAETWLELARRIEEIALLATHENGELRAELRIAMAENS